MRINTWYWTIAGWTLLLAGTAWALMDFPISAMTCYGAALVIFLVNIVMLFLGRAR
jgi:hypothetical protein